MQVDDGAKAAPEKFLNDGDDWMTIIEGSQKEIPQDHWGIGASIKVRLDGDRLVISADEPGYSESISLRIPALTARPEPAADMVEAAAEAMFTLEKNASGALVQWDDLLDNYGRNGVAGKAVYRDLARAALQAADAVDVFDAANSDSWPPPEMKDAPFIRYLHKIMKYHQPTITPQECWVAIGAVRMWMSRHPDRASETLQAAAVEPEPGLSLDAMLRHLTDDDLPGKTLSIYRHDGQWGAQQHMTHLEEQYPTDVCGHGDGVLEAIADAVARVKGEEAGL